MIGLIIRFVVSTLVLLLSGYIVPGFWMADFTGALIASMVITIIGYLTEKSFENDSSQIRRGLIGFITAAVAIYSTQLMIPGLINGSIIGALLAALVIGFINSFIIITLPEKEVKVSEFNSSQRFGADMEVATEIVQPRDKFHQRQTTFSELDNPAEQSMVEVDEMQADQSMRATEEIVDEQSIGDVEEKEVIQSMREIEEIEEIEEEQREAKETEAELSRSLPVQTQWQQQLNQFFENLNQFKIELQQQQDYNQLQMSIQKGTEALNQADQYIQSTQLLYQLNNSVEDVQQQLDILSKKVENHKVQHMTQFKIRQEQQQQQQNDLNQLKQNIQKGMQSLNQADQYIKSTQVLNQINNYIEQAQLLTFKK